jgi:hypothetical protein
MTRSTLGASEPSRRAPSKQLGSWSTRWFALRNDLSRVRDPQDKLAVFTELQLGVLNALGSSFAAPLTATEHGGAATGDVEVEYRKDGATTQEVEFQVTRVPPRAVLTLVIDGTAVISATADEQGRAEAEVAVAMPRQ